MADHAPDHAQAQDRSVDHSGDHAHDTARNSTEGGGTMDIRDQERTFEGFIRMVVWGAGISIGILIFMALANS